MTSIVVDYLEDSFVFGYRVSLECLVRLYCTVHQTYVFEEVKRTKSFDDMYDVGNLLMLGVHHAIALTVRRPETATLMIEDNIKNMYRMFAIESKVNQVLDINSLYLSWLLIKERKKDFDRKIVMLQLIMSEGRMFLKGFTNYLLEIDFDVTEFADYPDGHKFFLEDMIAEKLFDSFLNMDLSPIAENEDFLDSIFIWEYYKGEVDSTEYLILKMIMILRLYIQVISLIRDIIDVVRLSYGEPTSRNIAKIIHDYMAKMVIRINQTIKKNRFEYFVAKLKKSSPKTVDLVRDTLVEILTQMQLLGQETTFVGAIIQQAVKENVDITMNRVLTSSFVAKLEVNGVSKLHKDFHEDMEKSIKFFKEVTFGKTN
jgi:macrodomain Ter protein organizer (MatP/YcbG family)